MTVSLRYKGKPDRGANHQADKVIELCFCRFVAIGEPMDGSKCDIHGTRAYVCEVGICQCSNYRPNVAKEYPNHWPRCQCGHIAQEHN